MRIKNRFEKVLKALQTTTRQTILGFKDIRIKKFEFDESKVHKKIIQKLIISKFLVKSALMILYNVDITLYFCTAAEYWQILLAVVCI